MRSSGKQQQTPRLLHGCRLGRDRAGITQGLVRLFALCLASASSAFAQGPTTGNLHGTVTDSHAAPVLAASVDLLELSTGSHTLLRSAFNGSYDALSLTPGSYQLTIASPGFRPVRYDVTVQLGSTTSLATTLQLGAASVEITVAADSSDGNDVQDARILGRSELASLPLDGRRWQSFAILTPQANPASSQLDLLSFSGLSPSANSTRLDGVDDDQSYSGLPRGAGRDSGTETEDEVSDATAGARSAQGSYATGQGSGRHPGMAYTFSEAAVREFRVTGQNDSALYGHAAGGVITTVSRSGSDDLHGSLFYLVRSSAFAARDPFAVATRYGASIVTTAVVRPHDLRHQFGGTLGGSLVPRHLFFFYAFDGQRRGFPAISSPLNPDFYRLSANQAALLANRGVRPGKVDAALRYLDSLTGSVARRQDQTINFGKLDWQPHEHERFSLEYNRARSSAPAGGRSATVVNRGLASFGNSDVSVDALIGRWIQTLTPHLTNEVRGQFGRDLHLERAQAPLAQEPAISPAGLAPEVVIGPDGLIFGTPASISQGPAPEEFRTQAAEVLTWVHGRHLLQLGGDFSHVRDHIETLPNAAGTFRYDSGSTNGNAGGLVDWITDYTFSVNSYPNGGCPSINATIHLFCFQSFSQSFGGQSSRFNTSEWAGFLQEDWRLSQRLLLSAGLRYEYEFLPLPQRPNAALDRVFGAFGATNTFPEDRNNLGPRLGFAWQPFPRGTTTLRAAYGLYFGRLPGATIRSALADTALPSTTTRIRILPNVETACPQVANQGFGYPCAFLAAPPSGIVSTTSAIVFDRRFRLPISQQASVSLEHDFGALKFAASYRMNLTEQLPNSTDINIAPSTSTRSFILAGGSGAPGVRTGSTFSLPLYTKRVDSALGPVTAIVSNVNASYHALVLEARSRTRHGLQFRASWTWSKSLDYGQTGGAIPPTNGQLDPFNVRYDKALSSFNYPHKLAASAVWNVPGPGGASALVRAFASGWTLAPILVESSGRPYSYNVFGGTRLAGGHLSLNGSGGSVYLPTVGRNVLHLPEQVDLNLRLAHELRLREHSRLRFTADVFNLPNHRNLTAVNERAFLLGTPVNAITPLLFQNAATITTEGLNTQPFGSVRGAGEGQARQRQIQIGARLEF